jgi:hypothetical protein
MYEQEFYETVALLEASIATPNFRDWSWFTSLVYEVKRLSWLGNIG